MIEMRRPLQSLKATLRGQAVDRIPVVPKIWIDFSAKVTNTDYREVIKKPVMALQVIANAGKILGFDAVRQFQFPAKKIIEEDDGIYEIDDHGKKIGRIDFEGGASTYLFDSEDYKIEDPRTIAYCHSWTPPEPVVNSVSDAKRIAVPDSNIFNELGWAKNQKFVMEQFGEELAFIGDLDSATMSFYITFRDINSAMMDLISQPELVHAVMEKGAQVAISRGKYWLDNEITILRLNDSTGNMGLMSPQHWKEFVYPYIKMVCEELHAYNKDALIYCHICGNILPVMDKLVEAGLDCIGPLDPLGGFTVLQARKAVGDSVSLYGGVNTLSLLNNTPQEVKKESIKCIKEAGNKGGYVLGSGCVVPRDCPPENLIAMVDAAKEMEYSEV